MPTYAGKRWKTFNLNTSRSNRQGSGAMEIMDGSVNWYNRLLSNPVKRRDMIHRYLMMDQTLEISRALDIMAEDISGTSIDDTDVFTISFDEDSKLKKTTIDTIEKTKKYWKERTGFDINFYDNVREMLLYGSVFFKIEDDCSLTRLVPSRIEGYILEPDDDTKVSAYLYNNGATYTNEEGDEIGSMQSAGKESYEPISVDSLLILKIGSGPFGTSVLERAYRTWRHIQLIEDAVIVYRIMRAPERRIFYIDVGNQSGLRAEATIERVKLKMRQRQTQRNGAVDSEYRPQSLYEDYFVATNGDSRSSKVETLPGGQNLDQIKDLMYFNKKLAIGLRIPTSYMQSYYSDEGPQVATDARVGTAYIEELRYAGYIIRVQTIMNKHLFEHFKMYAHHIGVVLPIEQMKFEISKPQSFALYRENDLYSTLFNTLTTATGLEFVSKKFALQKFLHLEKEEMLRNELMVLAQKGYTKEQTKEMSQDQIDSVVYGDKEVSFDTSTNTPVVPITNQLKEPEPPDAPSSPAAPKSPLSSVAVKVVSDDKDKSKGAEDDKKTAAASAKSDKAPVNKKDSKGSKDNEK